MKTPLKILLCVSLISLLNNGCTKKNEPQLVPKTVDEDPSLPAIAINGVLLHSEAVGNPDSSIIVCIHGGPLIDYRYLLNCRDLAGFGYRVVFYDQTGSGLSQRFPESYYTDAGEYALTRAYDELGEVIAYYKKQANQKIYLLGHSWGAMLATAYTGKHPEQIAGLILSEPGGLIWIDVMEYVQKSRQFSFFGETLNNVTYTDQMITNNSNDHELMDYKMGLGAASNSVTGDDTKEDDSFWRLGYAINHGFTQLGVKYEPDFSEGISGFDKNILFFYSSKNKAYTDEWAKKITAVYKSVDIHKVQGVGHGGIITNSNAWNNTTLPAIINYLNSLN